MSTIKQIFIIFSQKLIKEKIRKRVLLIKKGKKRNFIRNGRGKRKDRQSIREESIEKSLEKIKDADFSNILNNIHNAICQ